MAERVAPRKESPTTPYQPGGGRDFAFEGKDLRPPYQPASKTSKAVCVEAELEAFLATANAGRYRLRPGVQGFLEMLARRGRAVREIAAADVVAFRGELAERGPEGARLLTAPQVERLVEGMSAYVRHKVALGEVGIEIGFALGSSLSKMAAYAPDARVGELVRESLAFGASLAGYAQSTVITYRRAAFLLLLHLHRRGKTLQAITAEDWARYRSEALAHGQGAEKDRHQASALALVFGARAFLMEKAKQGEIAAEQVFPAPRYRRPELALPDGLASLPKRLDEVMEAEALASGTRTSYRNVLRDFLRWLVEVEGIESVLEVTRDVMTAYRLDFQGRISRRGRPYSISTQLTMLAALRLLFSWLVKTGQLLSDPISHLPGPRACQRLPRVLRISEVRRLIGRVPKTTIGLRDRALLELLYGTGMRRGEAAALTLSDVDFDEATVLIREGKGRTERLVPLGAKAKEALLEYLDLSRGKLLKHETNALLLSMLGRPLSRASITRQVGVLAKRVGLVAWPHLLRHCCATHLLKRRADIRQIQRLLGHRSLETTQRYTQVEVSDLKEVVKRCHPRGRLS